MGDFQSPDGEPAAWAPGHPFHRGQELDKIILGGVGSSLSLSPDNRFLAVGVGKNIHVYSTFTREHVETLTDHLDEVSRVFFAPRMIGCGLYTLVSSAEGSMVVWELYRDGKNVSAEENKVDIDTLSAKAADTAISELKQITLDGKFASYGAPFSPDGQKMVYVTQNSTTQNGMRDAETLPCVNIWDVEAKVIRHRLLGHTDTIMWVATSPDSTLVASISWDGTTRIWDADDGTCLQVLGPFGQMWSGAFSPDSKYITISQGSPKTVVYVYDIEKAEEISHFEGCEHWARSLNWSPDGKLLAKLGWRLKFDNRLLRIFAEIHEVKFIDAGTKLMFRSTERYTEVYDFTTNTKQQLARGPGCQLERGSTSKPICTANSSLLVVSDADGAVRFWRFRG
ncbi:WD40-repeat-containing domain protein [Aspergillus parasiticus]|uniref:WD40-repeat-containing domain protein n=1 Tax=Aspergillus parasiticus TaxID=5067 RepID=A0A5N6DS70_ASPPA|nr:WD40-repeat-containing domain protein [Aspergillus parasiticus]